MPRGMVEGIGRGRPPTPTALHKLRGNPGKRKHNDREPAPPAFAVVGLAWVWRRPTLVHVLAGMGTACKRPVPATWERGAAPPVGARACQRCSVEAAKIRHSLPKVPAPDWMDAIAAAAWDRLFPLLEDMRVITAADWMALELLCQAYAEYRDAVERIRKQGPSIWVETKSGGYMMPNPAIRERNDAWRRVLAGLIHFGLTPSSRARIQVLPKDDEGDPFAEFDKPKGVG